MSGRAPSSARLREGLNAIVGRAVLGGFFAAGFCVLALGCTSVRYSAPGAGATIDEVAAAQQRASKRPTLLITEHGRRIALYGVDGRGALDATGKSSVSMLVFEDDRYLGTLASDVALAQSACLAQPDGLQLLADRLRALVAGGADPLAQPAADGVGTTGDARCPAGPDGAPTVARESAGSKTSAGKVVGAALLAPVIIVLGLLLLPVAASAPQAAYAHDAPSLRAQEQIVLDMSGEEIAQAMGAPSATFLLEPAQWEVRYFERRISPPLWVALGHGRVVWLRFGESDPWLEAVTKRLQGAARPPR